MCYGYIYALENKLKDVGIQMTYCYIPTEEVRTFSERIPFAELEKWFMDLLHEYAKWAVWQIKWQERRNESIQELDFPFEYREGQQRLVKGVYQSILRRKRLYIEAPTGVGKTISTVFPAVKSIGEGVTEKIFYLTAKTITRTVAEETFSLLSDRGMQLKFITLTAKEKICLLDKPQCNPQTFPRALGHFDRINDAVYDILTHEDAISRERILAYAEKHDVCPFEMSLDISTWCDAIIGDYNYAFDPTACLKRFFALETENDYVFLIDEAHNLVDRAREMYSSCLVKEDFLKIKKIMTKHSRKTARSLERCNKELLELKRGCEERRLYDPIEIEPFVMKALRLSSLLEEYLHGRTDSSDYMALPDITPGEPAALPLDGDAREEVLAFYFELRYFLAVFETIDDKYIVYADYDSAGAFCLHLQCMDPSGCLKEVMERVQSTIFFSATLLPIRYYKEQLGGEKEDAAVYAKSVFLPEQRKVMIARDVTTKYTRRGAAEYEKIAAYIDGFISAKEGNYLLFFPSYRFMDEIVTRLPNRENQRILVQMPEMREREREEFLEAFSEETDKSVIGCCVMGGIFSEGIDLKEECLIGAVVVGTGIPMVCHERELFKDYYEEKKGDGFSYAYLYPAVNKVFQAGGRVIRTINDKGAILLLDERFMQKQYQDLFPREWYPFDVVNCEKMKELLAEFWQE